MPRSEKPLFIPLRSEYFDEFAAGTKSIEYRRHGRRWNANTCRVGRRVTLSRGYGKQHRLHGAIVAFSVSEAAAMLPAFVQCYGPGESVAACITIELDQPEGGK